MILRICVIGTTSPGIIAAGGVAGLGEGTDDEAAGVLARTETGAAAGSGLSRKAMMSCLVMRPPMPLPWTCDKFTLCSRAILRTRGEDRACSSSSCAGWAIVRGSTGEGGADAAASVFAGGVEALEEAGTTATPSPSPAIVPTTVFTCTVFPSTTLMSCRTPEAGAGISASTLSVEISNSGSSRCTLSPGFFSHFVIVPSKIDSPIWGITISVGINSFHAVPVENLEPHAIFYYIQAPRLAVGDYLSSSFSEPVATGPTPNDFLQYSCTPGGSFCIRDRNAVTFQMS